MNRSSHAKKAVKDIDNTTRTHRNTQSPAKLAKSAPSKKSISVAAVFKQHQHRVQKTTNRPRQAVNHANAASEDVMDEDSESLKSQPGSHNQKKKSHRVSEKSLTTHPLYVEFKDTTDEYRRTLYQNATNQINNTLKTHLRDLHEGTLQTIESNPNDNQTSPIRLTVAAKFERESLKLYQPISTYRIRLTHTDTNGKRIQFMSTLGKRMSDYEDYIAKQKAEIEEMRNIWLVMVGEIWKLGVHCLGEESMESMLFTQKDTHGFSSSPTRPESTLFVPEQGASPPPRAKSSSKRVTFEAPDAGDEVVDARSKALEFLYEPSRLRQKDIPVMPTQEITSLEKQIKNLGRKEVEEYQKAERDYKTYWQHKVAKFREVMEED